MQKELIIKVDNKGIYLSPNLIVPIQQSNIPFEHCKFRTHEEIFWKVELIEFNDVTLCWKMKVLDYSVSDTNNFERQKSTKIVERIAFEKFNWIKFEEHLSSYQKIKLLDVLDNHDTDRFFKEVPKKNIILSDYERDFSKEIPENIPTHTALHKFPESPKEIEPIIKTLRIEFYVYFTEAHFTLGYVSFSKNIKDINQRVNFKILNDFLLPEFENIKSWFAKILKTKKIKVNASITTSNEKVIETTATSPQIEMINAELIDSIKYQRTFALTKPARISEVDKSLFSTDEIFGNMDSDDLEGNVFRQNENEVLSFLIDNYKTRNRKQLEYLSGSKQSKNYKLRFTLHPNFGFLFFIEGQENNHFVWELLNSHATYIWSIDKSVKEIELQYKRIELSINIIRDNGRIQYKRSYRQNHHDNDLVFSIIEHDDISSNLIEGFVKWKHKLNEKIT